MTCARNFDTSICSRTGPFDGFSPFSLFPVFGEEGRRPKPGMMMMGRLLLTVAIAMTTLLVASVTTTAFAPVAPRLLLHSSSGGTTTMPLTVLLVGTGTYCSIGLASRWLSLRGPPCRWVVGQNRSVPLPSSIISHPYSIRYTRWPMMMPLQWQLLPVLVC
jgi:hypothetical protein